MSGGGPNLTGASYIVYVQPKPIDMISPTILETFSCNFDFSGHFGINKAAPSSQLHGIAAKPHK